MKLLIEIGGRTRYSSQGGYIMSENQMSAVVYNLNAMYEEDKLELQCYRNLGSVQHLRKLKEREARRLRSKRRVLKSIKNTIFATVAAADLWIFVSWIDIILHNSSENPVYQIWNFFQLIV